MKEFYDGRLRLMNNKGQLSIMLLDNEQLPKIIMKLDRNKEQILGFIRLMKGVENTPKETIHFIRGALYDCYRYDKLKFNKRNPKDMIVDPELVNLTKMVKEYKEMLEEEE